MYKLSALWGIIVFLGSPLAVLAQQEHDVVLLGEQEIGVAADNVSEGVVSQLSMSFLGGDITSWLLGTGGVVAIVGLVLWNGLLQRRIVKMASFQKCAQSGGNASDQALLVSQQRYATLFNAADDAVFIIENDSVVDCNSAAMSMFACSKSVLLHKSLFYWSAAFQPDGFDSQDKVADILVSAEVGEPLLFDWLYRRADGEEFDAEVSFRCCDDNGEKYILTIVRDISESKRVDSLKDEFISTVSHEIRTPLTSILGSLKLVLSGDLKGGREQEKPMLQIAHNNAERLLALVNDLLDIQKLASKHSQLSYEEVSIADFLQQAVVNNQAYAEQYNVNLQLENVSEYYFALIDQAKLMQVMNNLLSNAAKFSLSSGQVEIKTQEIGFMLRISVTDHGVGIAEEFQSHVFERFTQADSTSTRQVGGTGLGLNISQAIVEQHGGQLGFMSKEGEGSTFYFDIPFESTQKNHLTGQG